MSVPIYPITLDEVLKTPPIFDFRDPASVTKYLDHIAKTSAMLARRLAPGQLFQKVQFQNVAAGTQGGGVNNANGVITGTDVKAGTVFLRRPYNAMLACVSAGQIDWCFGNPGQSQTGIIGTAYDLFCGQTVAPIMIPLPEQSEGPVFFWADSGATAPTVGTIWFMEY